MGVFRVFPPDHNLLSASVAAPDSTQTSPTRDKVEGRFVHFCQRADNADPFPCFIRQLFCRRIAGISTRGERERKKKRRETSRADLIHQGLQVRGQEPQQDSAVNTASKQLAVLLTWVAGGRRGGIRWTIRWWPGVLVTSVAPSWLTCTWTPSAAAGRRCHRLSDSWSACKERPRSGDSVRPTLWVDTEFYCQSGPRKQAN